MEDRKKLLIFGSIAVVAIIVAGIIFLRGADNRNEQGSSGEEEIVDSGQNNLTVRAQLPGENVLVDSVNITGRGYIAVYEVLEDGTAGTVIGNTDLIGGSLENVAIPIGLPTMGGETLIFMLHGDQDNDGEFILENDSPLTDADGKVILIEVTVIGEKPEEAMPEDPTSEIPVDEGMVESTSTVQ